MHPHKIGIPPGRYATDAAPLPAGTAALAVVPELSLPDSADDLVPYLRGILHSAAPDALDVLIEHATAEVLRTFPAMDVLATLRRALS